VQTSINQVIRGVNRFVVAGTALEHRVIDAGVTAVAEVLVMATGGERSLTIDLGAVVTVVAIDGPLGAVDDGAPVGRRPVGRCCLPARMAVNGSAGTGVVSAAAIAEGPPGDVSGAAIDMYRRVLDRGVVGIDYRKVALVAVVPGRAESGSLVVHMRAMPHLAHRVGRGRGAAMAGDAVAYAKTATFPVGGCAAVVAGHIGAGGTGPAERAGHGITGHIAEAVRMQVTSTGKRVVSRGGPRVAGITGGCRRYG